MTFTEAMRALQRGSRVQRPDGPVLVLRVYDVGEVQTLKVAPAVDPGDVSRESVAIREPSGKEEPGWEPSKRDADARDWLIDR